MSDILKDRLDSMRRASRRTLRRATRRENLQELREGAVATRERASETARAVAHSPVTQAAVKATRVAVASGGPVREVAKICGRAGVAGAVVDGSLGTINGVKAMREGKITGRQVLIHTGAEAGCGFVTSSSGTAGTIVAYMITGTMGPMALVAGMGASIGTRYAYRKVVGETLPTEEAVSDGVAGPAPKEPREPREPVVEEPSIDEKKNDADGEDPFEKIGPDA